MIRTQISLDPEDYQLAKREAEALGVPVAELLRRAQHHVLPATSEAAWMRYAGFVESGNAKSSQTIDEIVYGVKD